jgi:hypothetical protein
MAKIWRQWSAVLAVGALAFFGSPQIASAAKAPATPIAKTATEAAFIRLAISSCNLAMAKGFTEVMGDTNVAYKPVKDSSGLYDATNWVASTSDEKQAANPFEFWQPLCFPANLNASFAYTLKHRETFNPGLEHKFAKLNSSTFVWTQHMGSADWSAFTYTVKSGLIVGFSGAPWQDTKVFYAK